MFEDTEDESDVDEDFHNALALLHSTDDDSTEKLRKMLDATVERKYGFDKTLMAKKFLQNNKIRGKSFANDALEKQDDFLALEGGNSAKKLIFVEDVTDDNWRSVKIYETEFEDYTEKGDIPRISIPDEGSGDGLLCKICNGAKLGPLILLECQDCQEVYHPLCHQPPVVDIDVYDPRIVWRCSKCNDTTSVNTAVAFDEKKPKKFRRHNDTNNSKEVLTKNETGVADENSPDIFQKTGCPGEGTVYAKESSQIIQKTITVSSNQLRKRIGSKLSVTRAVAKSKKKADHSYWRDSSLVRKGTKSTPNQVSMEDLLSSPKGSNIMVTDVRET
ncbi:integrator complex subunit 12 [Ptiloglossa arizonensis]|uniref:integrator complex subunit 12 n=1 Tax=Ptiloglossa arizonensis TaxID=3350558 RepID=UPI003F9F3C43